MSEVARASPFANTPQPPYYAVIFTSLRREEDEGYAEMAQHILALALVQPGCLGVESARDARGFGVTVAYFASKADIAAWREHAEHRLAQEYGRTKWYAHYEVRVARVERAYSGPSRS
ncbi:MAG TPA: antibiotic biosynthesis monooxygenase [Rhodoblastus sp.]|nr:antibiotic biosynthesis monooxygenase [Rhodoblastus sp.]